MVRRKSVENRKKSETDIGAVSPDCRAENGKIYGFRFAPSFSDLIDKAAKKAGMTRSNFVRVAIANAISAVDLGEFVVREDVCRRQGQQTAPKDDVLARAAGARAVRYSKKPETPEHVRRLELLALGYDEEVIGAYLYAKARAEKTVGRPLTPEEDDEFITSAAARIAEIKQCYGGWGEGPPNM